MTIETPSTPFTIINLRLRAHAADFLQSARVVRTALQVTAVASPVLVGALKAIPATTLNPTGTIIAATLQFIFLFVGAAAGLLVLLTDRSALVIIRDANDISDQLEELRRHKVLQDRYVEQLESELTRTERVTLTVDSMRVAIDVALSPSPPSIEAQMREMLDLLVASKSTLFGIGDEQWNFSVYVWDDTDSELKCVACRRPARADEDAPHRSWKPGEGHVGKAFQMGRPLICADSTDPNVRGFFDAPEGKRAAYDDRERYRSLAAVPFRSPGTDVIIGVVVATSDIPDRFKPSTDGNDEEAIRPIRALSKTLATLSGVTTIRHQQEPTHAPG